MNNHQGVTGLARCHSFVLLSAALCITGCTEPAGPSGPSEAVGASADDVLNSVVDGLGGREALEQLATLTIEAKRTRYVMGQGPEPGIGLHRYSMSDASISHDLANDNFRGDFNHTGQYIGAGAQRPVTELVIGQAGYVMGWNDFFLQNAASNDAMTPERVATTVKTERLLNPHILIREALRDPSLVSAGSQSLPDNLLSVSADAIFPITLSRFRETGKRVLVSNEEWFQRWQGTRFYKDSVAERVMFESGADWLASWQANAVNAGTHTTLTLKDDVYPITLHVNTQTGQIDKLVTMEKDYVYGDVALEVTYLDWQTFDGMSFPMHIKVSLAGAPSMDVRRSTVTINSSFDAGTFTAPQGVTFQPDDRRWARGERLSQTLQSYSYAAAARARAVVRPTIVGKQLGPGVHIAVPDPTDATYTMIVEQANGIVIIEPGFDDLKGEAIIDWINGRFPGKPITHAILSHNHADHAVGVRPYVAAGAAVVVHEAGVEFFEGVIGRPVSKILPDALDRNPVKGEVIGVPADSTFRIEDDEHPVMVYPVYNRHTSDMVIAWAENERILYLGDLYIGALARMLKRGEPRSPSGEPVFSAVELQAAIEKYNLDPVILMGSHDVEPVTVEDFNIYLGKED